MFLINSRFCSSLFLLIIPITLFSYNETPIGEFGIFLETLVTECKIFFKLSSSIVNVSSVYDRFNLAATSPIPNLTLIKSKSPGVRSHNLSALFKIIFSQSGAAKRFL